MSRDNRSQLIHCRVSMYCALGAGSYIQRIHLLTSVGAVERSAGAASCLQAQASEASLQGYPDQ